MRKNILSYVSGAVLAAGVGTASADPLALTESQMDVVTAGVGFTSNTLVTKLVNIEELIVEQKLALFQVETFVTGFSAVAEAEADADGPNADAQTFSFAEITPSTTDGFFKANSLSKSIALVSQ
jgi:hypothetical protein